MTNGSQPEDAGDPGQDRRAAYHADLRARISAVMDAPEAQKRRDMPALGRMFLRTVERGIPAAIKLFLDEGMDVNYQDAHTGQTALHVAAGAQAREAIRLLMKAPDCDFLIRDAQGRLASEHAYLFGNDPALARLLGNKERKQARTQGLTITRRATSRN